ncbi:RHS repeat-associated core domain-containing protein, partial [Microcystis aeruginosa]|uniref:RHS repeat-associated core domain-containing protein n=1 Tax=Microcystis aeruginosa TaxID=1126 RepID=UPI0026488E4F
MGEYGDTGSPIARYIHGIGLVGQANGENYNYYDTDAIGSVVGLSGATGSYLNRYSYLPFGEDLTKVEAIANPFEYVGQWGVMNEGNGLDFMRARFYDDKLGRFTSPDPIGVNGGDTNLYRYVFNHPIALTDPLGLFIVAPLLRSVIVGAIYGAGVYRINSKSPSPGGTLASAILGGLGGAIGFAGGIASVLSPTLGTQAKIFGAGIGTMGSYAIAFSDNPQTEQSYSDMLLEFIKNLLPPDLQFSLAAAESLVLLAFDPNDILGPTGFGDQNYLIPNHDFPYTIRFENLKSATAPAVFVTVTHTIDTDLNLDTFQLGDFGFGSIYVDVPDGLKAYSTSVDLTSTIGYFVDFEASLDTATRTVTWRLTTIDPLTGGLPLDPEAGFLPPNNDTHDGEGFINYTISPNANLTTNTTIDAEARIVFDFNSPIDTPKWTNTIDVDKPTSQVTALLTNSNTTFNVTWSGSDEGSGIASYDIYVSTDNGAYTLWKDNITATSAPFEGQPGKTYRFYSVATDNLGLIETAPTQPDATTTVGTVNVGPTDLALSATTVNENVPVNTVIGTFSSTDPDTGNTFTYSLIAGTGDTD